MFDPEKLATVKMVAEIISITVGIIVTVAGGLYAFWKTRGANADALVQNSGMSADEKVVVLNALKVWRYGAITFAVVLGLTSITLLVFALFPGPSQKTMSKYLAMHDPGLFRHPAPGDLYDFARVFPNTQSLQTETNLSETLNETKQTFDLFAMHGLSILQNFRDDVKSGLKRGIAYRVVLWDPSDANRTTFDLVSSVQGHKGDAQRLRVRECLELVRDLQAEVARDKAAYPGNLDLRVLAKPALFSIWIKDRNDSAASIAHISIPQYRGAQQSPSFRMSNKACKRALDGLKAEFERIWADARTPP